GTDAVAVQGDMVAPRRTPMPINAFALATMASFPSRPPGKAKVKRKNDDARECPGRYCRISVSVLPTLFHPDVLSMRACTHGRGICPESTRNSPHYRAPVLAAVLTAS